MPVTKPRRWTAAEVRKLINESPMYGPRYELIGGELLVSPSPGARHQWALAWLFQRIAPYVARERLGTVLWSPADLELLPGDITQPDLFVIPHTSGKRIPAWPEIKTLILAVEALSESTARDDRTQKRDYYQRAMVPDYWIVDHEKRQIDLWHPSSERAEIAANELTWMPAGAKTSLVLDLAELWAILESTAP